MNQEKFFILIGLVCLTVVASVLAMCLATFNLDRNEKMAEAIKSGAHPMDVYCAFDGSSESKVCLVRAAVKGDVK